MFIVKTASCPQKSRKFGRYAKVAVIELEEGVTDVAMISERAKGCKRIVQLWDQCSVGKTERSQFGRALAEATAMAAKLNAR